MTYSHEQLKMQIGIQSSPNFELHLGPKHKNTRPFIDHDSYDSTYFSCAQSDTSEHLENDISLGKSYGKSNLPVVGHIDLLNRGKHQDTDILTKKSESSTVLPNQLKHHIFPKHAEPILKAAALHQILLQLRLELNSLYAERQQIQKKLDAAILQRKNLANKVQELGLSHQSLPNHSRLHELHGLLSQETSRTAMLLDVVKNERKRIQFTGKCRKDSDICRNDVAMRLKAAEVQTTILEEYKNTPESHQDKQALLLQNLMQVKDLVCESLKGRIARLFELPQDRAIETVSTPDDLHHQKRLRVLQFGLDERKKKQVELEQTLNSLKEKLRSLKTEAFEQKLDRLQGLIVVVKEQRETYHKYRETLKSMTSAALAELNSKVASPPPDEMEATTRTKVCHLTALIAALRREIASLDQEPALVIRNLEVFGQTLENSIRLMDEQCVLIKSKIRNQHKQLKSLRPLENDVSIRINKLDALNCQLPVICKRLEHAEIVERRTREILNHQDTRVHDLKSQFNRVKELYAEEKRIQLERRAELEKETEEYKKKLLHLNHRLDRLGRRANTKCLVYKYLMASADEFDVAHCEEWNDCSSKRCALLCKEIKRLRQHTEWLEDHLRAVESKSLNRQSINSIKAALNRGNSQVTSSVVRRRSSRKPGNSRPYSMIEIGSSAVTNFCQPVVVDVQDTRRRKLAEAPSTIPSVPSSTQRRLEYSRSLRERKTPMRPGCARVSAFRQSVCVSSPLAYTAFRNTKFTPSRNYDATD